MAEEIHITKPLAVGNDSIAKGFFGVVLLFSRFFQFIKV